MPRPTVRLFFGLALLWQLPVAAITRAASPEHPVVPGFERFYGDSDEQLAAGGRLLLGELGCTNCHQPSAELKQQLLLKQAPILDGVANRVRPEFFHKLLADPQRAKAGTTMPDLLGHLPADRRTELVQALTQFLESGGAAVDTVPSQASAKQGDDLFHKVGCIACHGSQREGAAQLSTSVPLGDLAGKYTIGSLADFLRNPLAVRRSGRMPALNLEEKEALDIAHYFLRDIDVPANLAYKLYEGGWDKLPNFDSMQPKQTGEAAGFDLGVAGRNNNFGLRFEGFLLIATAGSSPLFMGSGAGSRLYIDGRPVVEVDGLHPYEVRTGKQPLSAGVHPIRVDYFQGGGEWQLTVEYQGKGVARQPLSGAVFATAEAAKPRQQPTRELNPELVEKGRQAFATIGCASCHQLKEENQPAIKSTLKAPSLAELRSDRGCLADVPAAPAPHFRLSAKQRSALRAALAEVGKPAETDPKLTVNHALTTLNCYACHVRDKIGGVEEPRNSWFVSTIPEMGDEGRIPPALDFVGDKITQDYLKHVFNNGAKDRPYMLTRMPKFGQANVGNLVSAFAELDQAPPTELPTFEEPLYRVKADGRHMVGSKAFSCIKCHTFGKYQATGIQSIDLTTMTRRLRPEWFQRYLYDPPAYRPGTRMPSPWPKGKPSFLRDILGGDSNKQIHAVWLYLADGPKARLPEGLTQQTIELVAEDEPVLYRNFIEGAGARAIGVGYPERANLAFDADGLRLAMIWHGAFIDASRHWSGRGQGFQGPLGDHVLPPPPGVPFAKLDSSAAAWPGASAAEQGYRFRGYRLDDKRRPIFLYSWDDVAVSDGFEPLPGEPDPMLRRTLTLTTTKPVEDAWFRAAMAGKIEPQSDGWYLIDGAWRMRIESSSKQTPTVRQQGGQAELLVPVSFADGKATIVQQFAW